jgi:hypothetical protein
MLADGCPQRRGVKGEMIGAGIQLNEWEKRSMVANTGLNRDCCELG